MSLKVWRFRRLTFWSRRYNIILKKLLCTMWCRYYNNTEGEDDPQHCNPNPPITYLKFLCLYNAWICKSLFIWVVSIHTQSFSSKQNYLHHYMIKSRWPFWDQSFYQHKSDDKLWYQDINSVLLNLYLVVFFYVIFCLHLYFICIRLIYLTNHVWRVDIWNYTYTPKEIK